YIIMDLIKKHASSFLQDKYKIARLAFTDVTEAELLAEEATNEDSCSPEPRTMTRIAEASYAEDDYWRIVDVLHRRLCSVDWKQWRQAYKALVLLEFLLTHGPLDFSEEFVCDIDVIHELGTFQFIDQKGINWGANMQRKSDEILKLLGGGKSKTTTALKEARLRALKVTKQIHGFGFGFGYGFGGSIMKPSSATSTSTTTTNTNNNNYEERIDEKVPMNYSLGGIRSSENDDDDDDDTCTGNVDNYCPNNNSTHDETNSFLDDDDEKERFDNNGFVGGIFSKLTNTFSPSSSSSSTRDYYRGFRSVSDVGRVAKKKYSRQSSLWY
ncbi:uncharacterized protein LOC133815754, partial [Humulus lupulus]|uniref:uncharacterized protein LOC133815754 n=1 Tax=Humulus lupulus TaxID=3486 RepID=UPI002B4101F6